MTRTTITMTSKGTFTMPADIRKKMGLTKMGDRLNIDFDPLSKEVRLSKPLSFDELRASNMQALPKGFKTPSDEELDAIIAEGWQQRSARSE